MVGMKSASTVTKVSISLPADIADFVAQYQESHAIEHRSEVFVQALELLRERELAQAYREASLEWDNSEDAKLWDKTVGDGL